MEEFIEILKIALSEHYGSEGEIVVSEMKKNNGVKVHSLRLDRKNLNMSPVLYAEDFYLSYKAGVAFEEILSEMIEIYNLNKNSLEVSAILDFKEVKDNLSFRVINYERNAEYLQNKPYIRVLDLAVVFYFNLMIDDASGVIAIDNNLVKSWGTTVDELFKLAKKNTRRIEGIVLAYLPQALELAVKNNPELLMDFAKINPAPMFVLTNKAYYKGAGCMLYLDILKDLADKLETDLYIIPSSVHECLVYPALHLIECSNLKSVIKSVNEDDIKETDILSDNLYLFRRSSNALEIVK